MADAAYDVVIVGGGTKALVTAIYLTKYAGMEVAIFERRHELGGGLCSHEGPAPGFIGDPHATWLTSTWYYPAVEQDFPDFVEKGGRLNKYKAAGGMITREDQKCLAVYSIDEDPTQEKTAREVARFAGERDAETYLKLWEYAHKPGSNFDEACLETYYNLPVLGQPTALDRWFEEFLKQPDCPVDEEFFVPPAYKAMPQLFDNPALNFGYLRMGMAAGISATQQGGGPWVMATVLDLPAATTARGGTHSIAHAYIRIFLESGGKFFTHSHVDKILIENDRAKGIRLSDGTEIEARKLVLSGVDPYQLCLQLIGKEHFSHRVIRKVEGLEGKDTGTITWYTWALCEPPRFKAAEINPDINEAGFITLGCDDLEWFPLELALRHSGKNPPVESTILHHQYGDDRSRAPEGRRTALTEQFITAVQWLSETEWLEFKKTHAEDVVREWGVYTDNLNWDNIIGCDTVTPYDVAGRLLNMPWGDWGIYNIECNRPASMKPILEFAQHRIGDIKNLYGTGASWLTHGGNCIDGYLAYKAIAEDLGLRKPWEEKGRPW